MTRLSSTTRTKNIVKIILKELGKTAKPIQNLTLLIMALKSLALFNINAPNKKLLSTNNAKAIRKITIKENPKYGSPNQSYKLKLNPAMPTILTCTLTIRIQNVISTFI